MSEATARVEAVARAICKARGIDPDAAYQTPQRYYDTGDEQFLKGVGESQWKRFRQRAVEFVLCSAAIFGGQPYSESDLLDTLK